MKIGHIELCVENPAKSLKFYQEILGFELVHNQDNTFIWIKLEDIEILLKPSKKRVLSTPFEESPFNIVLYTNNLKEKRSELQSKGLKFEGEDQGCPIFRDLDGHWFQLVNPDEH